MPIDMPQIYQSVEIIHETPFIKTQNVYLISQKKNTTATEGFGLKNYGLLETGSNSSVSLEIEVDEYSKQMALAKQIMKKNQAVLKRLAE